MSPNAPHKSGRDKAVTLLKYIVSLSVLSIFVRSGAFVEKLFLAGYFGIEGQMDAFNIALRIPMMVFFVIGAVMSPTLLPVFVRRSEKGDLEGAWAQVHSWACIFFVGISGLLVFGFAFSEEIIRFLAPGFEQNTHSTAVQLFRILLPTSVGFGLLPILSTVLNAKKGFSIPPMAEFSMKVVIVIGLVLMTHRFGILAAAYALVLGISARLIISLLGIARKTKWTSAKPKFSDPDFRIVLFLMMPIAAGITFSQFGSMIEDRVCSELAVGTISALSFARKIVDLPLMIISLASGTVLFTYFAELAGKDDKQALTELLSGSVRVMLFIFLPLAILTSILAQPIASVVYQRGAFTAESAERVAHILLWLAPVMCCYAIEIMMMRYYFARLDMWPPILIGMACVILKIALIYGTVGVWGISGVVFAIVISRIVKVSLLLFFICQRMKIHLHDLQLAEWMRFIPAAGVAGGIGLAAKFAVAHSFSDTLIGNLGLMTTISLFSISTYIALSTLLGARECRFIWRRIATS